MSICRRACDNVIIKGTLENFYNKYLTHRKLEHCEVTLARQVSEHKPLRLFHGNFDFLLGNHFDFFIFIQNKSFILEEHMKIQIILSQVAIKEACEDVTAAVKEI